MGLGTAVRCSCELLRALWELACGWWRVDRIRVAPVPPVVGDTAPLPSPNAIDFPPGFSDSSALAGTGRSPIARMGAAEDDG